MNAFIESVKLGAERGHVDTLSKDETAQLKKAYQACFDEMQKHISEARPLGRAVFVKEHIFFMLNPVAKTNFLFPQQGTTQPPWTVDIPGHDRSTHSPANKTLLSDEFLQGWKPIFLIRHPAMVFPSFYRATLDIEAQEVTKQKENLLQLTATMHWSRTLYDWYAAQNNHDPGTQWPIVLEADDIMGEPAMLVRFCEIVGLDPSRLRFTWSPANERERENLTSTTQRMKSTLLASSGVMTGKSAGNLDIEVEARKWRQEFGKIQGAKMEEYVRAAMPDYEYLKARRLRPKFAES
jgi:hypothetical protein